MTTFDTAMLLTYVAIAVLMMLVIMPWAVAARLTLVTRVYMHAHMAHTAYKIKWRPVKLWFEYTMFRISVNVIRWAAVHIKHHRTSDGPEDPHSPLNYGEDGIDYVLEHNVELFRVVAQDDEQVEKYAGHLLEDPTIFHKWTWKPATKWPYLVLQFTHWLPYLAVYIVMVLLLGIDAPWGVHATVLLATFLMAIYSEIRGAKKIYVYKQGQINSIGHAWPSDMPRSGHATNIWPLCKYSAGEGNHFWHHYEPTSARFSREGAKRREDWGWEVIKLGRWLGAFTDVNEPKLPIPDVIPTVDEKTRQPIDPVTHEPIAA